MKTIRGILCLITVAVVLVGCETTYQKSLTWSNGGYYDEPLDNGDYLVGVTIGNYAPLQTRTDFALLRSSEIAIEHGASYFEWVSGGTSVRTVGYGTAGAPVIADTANTEYIIKLHETKPERPLGKVFEARSTAEEARQRLKANGVIFKTDGE